MRLKHLTLLLVSIFAIVSLSVEMLYVDGMTHFINVGNLLIRVSQDDLQLGAMYSHERTKVRRIGFLRFKEAQAELDIGFTLGRGWSAIVAIGVETYGLAPSNYDMLFCVGQDKSYALINVEQKFFLGNYVVNFSSFDSVGPVTLGMSRMYLRAQGREIGLYRLDSAVFAGFYPLTRGQTGDEGFFIGVGWKDGFSGALGGRFRFSVKETISSIDVVLVLSQEKPSLGIRGEWVGEKFKAGVCFVDGKIVFRVSF